MFERHHFAQDLASGWWTMTELCARYGISRNTGYKWRERFLALGMAGLAEHRRAPLSSPNETAPAIIEASLAEHTRYGWGAQDSQARADDASIARMASAQYDLRHPRTMGSTAIR